MIQRKLEKGFTMIELITVLLLIGMLSAYAVPKFYGTSDAAANKVAQQAVAEGVSLLKTAYANCLLNGTALAETTAGASVLSQLATDTDLEIADGKTIELGTDFSVKFEVGTSGEGDEKKKTSVIQVTGFYKEGDTIKGTAGPKDFKIPVKSKE